MADLKLVPSIHHRSNAQQLKATSHPSPLIDICDVGSCSWYYWDHLPGSAVTGGVFQSRRLTVKSWSTLSGLITTDRAESALLTLATISRRHGGDRAAVTVPSWWGNNVSGSNDKVMVIIPGNGLISGSKRFSVTSPWQRKHVKPALMIPCTTWFCNYV